METFHRLKNWLVALLGYGRRNSDLSEEIAFHIEMRTDLNIEAGMSPKDARSAALKEFGGIDKIKEQTRDSWGTRIVVDQVRNITFGLRLSIRYRSSSILAVCVLGIGIGTSIAMYTISTIGLDLSAGGNLSEKHQLLDWDTGTRKGEAINTQDFKIIREEIESLEDLVAMKSTSALLKIPGKRKDKEYYKGLFATSNLFNLTDTAPLHGRLFSRNALDVASNSEIVISYSLWNDFFDRNESAIGTSLFVNDKEHMIVGVMPAGFAFPRKQKFWVSTDWQEFDGEIPENTPTVVVVGKLIQNTNIEESLAELNTLSTNLSGSTAKTGSDKLNLRLRPHKQSFIGDKPLEVILIFNGGAFLVLMLACSNVFHIIISRTAKRSHELAVRCSLGARRGHVMWQVIVDGLTLSCLGAILGIGLAAIGLRAFSQFLKSFDRIPGVDTFQVSLRLEPGAIYVAIGAALVAGIAASVIPAWRASKIDAYSILKADFNSSSSIFVGWLSKGIVISQVAFSAVLIFLSYLFLVFIPSNFSKTIDLPYNQDSVLTAPVGHPYKKGSHETHEFYIELKKKLQAVPGVRATALSSDGPGIGEDYIFEFEFQGDDRVATDQWAQVSSESPDFLEVYGLDLKSGRMFNSLDTMESNRVCLVNVHFVETYCKSGDPIGLRLRLVNHKNKDAPTWFSIIGVIPNHKPESIRIARERIILPYTQTGSSGATILINAKEAGQARYRQAIRQAVRELVPEAQFPAGILTVKESFDQSLELIRTISTAGKLFGGIILFMSMVGLYSIVSFTTEQRRKEFGIRIAVGATNWGIAKTVLKPWILMTCGGLIIGFFGVMFLQAAILAYMESIKAPTIALGAFENVAIPYLLVSIIICCSSFVAVAVPVRRALQIPPMEVIRID